jgi:hypothetical protein
MTCQGCSRFQGTKCKLTFLKVLLKYNAAGGRRAPIELPVPTRKYEEGKNGTALQLQIPFTNPNLTPAPFTH